MEVKTFEVYTDTYSVIIQAPAIEDAVKIFRAQDGQEIVCICDCAHRDAQYLERRQHLLKMMDSQTRAWIREDLRKKGQAELFDE